MDARGNRLWPHDLRVNLGEAPAYQSTPQIATDSQGNAIVVWAEHTNPYFGVHAQKFSPTGARLWANEVRVNGEPAYRMDWGHEGSLAIAMDGQDNVIVVWEGEWQYTWTDPDVYAQKVGRDGQRLWATDVKVNSDNIHRQRIMAVDVDASGVSVVAWVDERNAGEDIYAQRLDATGPTPVGAGGQG
ncbi:MAG: hypothetical protein IPO15_22125 [Anaerolineae bacterium]|nr:hypothetical protein [Anaerolineae bacterium]